ncbi:MAG TPA: PHP domain-containing protein [Longimicrobiales bacterium]
MHLHTRASFDCLNDPRALLDAARSRGIDVVCITDHNEIANALLMKARFPDRVIAGEEVKTAEGVDIIGLFIRELIPGRTPARRTCELIRAQGGLVYMPHPYAPGKGGDGRILEEVADLVHIVEGFNGRLHHPALNERAVAWARAHSLPIGAGSDAHTLAEVGRAFVELPDFEDTPESFRRAIESATIHGRASSRLVHAASTYAKLHKRIFTDPEWT